jgi:HEAT repeat protein
MTLKEKVADDSISAWKEKLNDKDWHKRYDAVYYLNKLGEKQKTEKVKKALIDLLWKEVTIEIEGKTYIRRGIPTPGWDTIADPKIRDGVADGHAEYFSALLNAVVDLRDIRTIPILVEFMGHSRKALEEIGEPAVLPLIRTLHNEDPMVKSSAAKILGEMLEEKEGGYTARGETRKKIKDALIEALKENAQPKDRSEEWEEIIAERTSPLRPPGQLPDSTAKMWFETRIMLKSNVRLNVVRALTKLGDRDVIPLLKEISENDPYTEKRKDGSVYYPVREAAAEAIKKLESGSIEKEE